MVDPASPEATPRQAGLTHEEKEGQEEN